MLNDFDEVYGDLQIFHLKNASKEECILALKEVGETYKDAVHEFANLFFDKAQSIITLITASYLVLKALVLHRLEFLVRATILVTFLGTIFLGGFLYCCIKTKKYLKVNIIRFIEENHLEKDISWKIAFK